MIEVSRSRFPGAMQRSSRCFAEPGPPKTSPSWPGLTRPSIFFERVLRRAMDARVKPAHDEVFFVTAPALQRTASQGLRHSASKMRVNALMALRPGNEGADHD